MLKLLPKFHFHCFYFFFLRNCRIQPTRPHLSSSLVYGYQGQGFVWLRAVFCNLFEQSFFDLFCFVYVVLFCFVSFCIVLFCLFFCPVVLLFSDFHFIHFYVSLFLIYNSSLLCQMYVFDMKNFFFIKDVFFVICHAGVSIIIQLIFEFERSNVINLMIILKSQKKKSFHCFHFYVGGKQCYLHQLCNARPICSTRLHTSKTKASPIVRFSPYILTQMLI